MFPPSGRVVEIASEGGRPLPLAGMGHAGLADVLLDRGELDAALDPRHPGRRTLPAVPVRPLLAWEGGTCSIITV